MPDSLELAPTLSDVGRHPEIAMAVYKPEVVITRERHEISARFQRILYVLDHAQHTEAISNIVRCRTTSGRQPEIAMAAKNRFVRRHCYFGLSVGCRSISDNVGDSFSVLGVIENIKYPLKSRRYLIPFPSYYYFRFIGRHCYFRMSADIGQCRGQFQSVGRGRNCWVAVEISPISHAVPELLLLPVYRPPLLFPDVARHQTMSGPVPMSRAWPKMWG